MELLDNWNNFKENPKGNFYPGDDVFLKSNFKKYCCHYNNLSEYTKSIDFGNKRDKKFHIRLLPSPFVGKLNQAKIFILLSNPGLNLSNYIDILWIDKDNFKEVYFNNLKQKGNDEYPFFYLDPNLCSHPGYHYWSKVFDPLIKKIKETKNLRWIEAQQKLAKIVAVLELVPYHSKHLRITKAGVKGLKSITDVKKYVNSVLLEKAKKNECVVVVARSAKCWEINENINKNNILISKTRSVNLGEKSLAFRPICEFLNII